MFSLFSRHRGRPVTTTAVFGAVRLDIDFRDAAPTIAAVLAEDVGYRLIGPVLSGTHRGRLTVTVSDRRISGPSALRAIEAHLAECRFELPDITRAAFLDTVAVAV